MRLQSARLFSLLICLWTLCGTFVAQAQTAQSTSATAVQPHKPAQPHLEVGPKWSELKPEQQATLLPLEHLWSGLEENRKRKWLAIAKSFPTLSPQAQETAQQRMREWAALSPAQRSQARLNFAQLQQLDPEEKKAKWEAFQALNDEEKQKLQPIKPVLPKGAATAPKPISPEKLTTTPLPKEGQVKAPRIETNEVHPRTLLPVRKTSLTISTNP